MRWWRATAQIDTMPTTPRQNTSSAELNHSAANFTHTAIAAKQKDASSIHRACIAGGGG